MAVITPVYSPNSIIDYGAKVAWIEAAYNGQLRTPDGTGYLPRVQTLPLGRAPLDQASFEALPNTNDPSGVQAVVGSIASRTGLTVTPTEDATNLQLSSITLGDPVILDSKDERGANVTIDNIEGTTPIINTYTLQTQYAEAVTDTHVNGWSNSTEVTIGNKFAKGFFNEFSATIKNNFTYNASSTETTTETNTATNTNATTVTVAPGKKSLLQVLYREVTQDVPYTATLENTSGLETVKINGELPSGQSGTYEVFAGYAVNNAKQFLGPNSQFLGDDNGTPLFKIEGTFTGVNGTDFLVTQRDITPDLGAPTPVPEPGFVPGSVAGLALMIWRKLIKREKYQF